MGRCDRTEENKLVITPLRPATSTIPNYRLGCAKIYRRGLELGMFLEVLFSCRLKGGLLVLVKHSPQTSAQE
jgi:hypothetical protein